MRSALSHTAPLSVLPNLVPSDLAANMLLATFQLLAANLRKIKSFLEEEAERQRLADGGARSKAYNPDGRRPAFGPHGSTGELAVRPGLPAWFRPFAVDSS